MNPMFGEFHFLGLLIPRILVWLALAVVLGALVRRVMGIFDLYRFVWHPALFDMGMIVILFGAVIAAVWSLG